MKTRFKRWTAFVLAFAMALSLTGITAFAAGTTTPPNYAYLEIGAVSGKAGDTVKVPVYLKGLKQGDKCRGFDAHIETGENLTLEGADWTELVSGFGYKICNKTTGYFTAVDLTNSGFRITADGKVCDLLVKIADDAETVGALTFTQVNISGDNSAEFLNSTDGTKRTVDYSAVVTPVDENGAAAPVISIKTPAVFTMKVEADQTSVEAGEVVTVTVKVEGGDFVGAAAKLSYDSSKFTVKSADTGTGWSALTTGKGYAYYNVADGQSATLGTFVFTAVAQTEEVTGSFTLSDTYCEEEWESGAETTVATPCTNNGKVDVTIALKDDLAVTAEDKTVTYDGTAKSLDAVTSIEGATIAYRTGTDGAYDLTAVPTYTDAGSYPLYYKVTALGYAPKTGSYTLTIDPADIQYTAEDYSAKYDGTAHGITVTVTKPEGTTITYSETADGTYTDTAPTLTDVGSKTVWFKIDAGKNYNVVTGSKTITISDADITFDISANENATYDGKSHASATVNSMIPEDATVTYSWTEDGQTKTSKDTIPSFTDAGTYTVNYTVKRDNYTDKTGSYTFTIDKADITGYTVTAAADTKYDEQAHVSAAVTTGTPADATITYTYNGASYTTIPSFTDVGDYTVSYTISAGSNYNDATGTYTFKIEDGTIEAAATDVSAEYDGQPHSVTVTVTKPEGTTITYSETEDGTYTATAPAQTDAGSKTVYWKVTKGGYADKTGSATVTVTAKPVTITVDSKEKTLGDADPNFTGTVSGLVNDNDLGTITYTRAKGETVGAYDIDATYTANANYAVTVQKGTLTIKDPAYAVEITSDYVAGYSLVLVYTNDKATFTYDGSPMYDVTSAGYKYKAAAAATETEYDHVYALVVAGNAETGKVAAGTTPVADTLKCDDLDVNKSGSVDLRDAVAVVAVYNANETYMTKYMAIVLEADVNHDKRVDSTDFGMIKADYLK